MHKWEKNRGWKMKGVPLSTIPMAAEGDQRIFLLPFPTPVPPIRKQGHTPCCPEGPLFSCLLLALQCWGWNHCCVWGEFVPRNLWIIRHMMLESAVGPDKVGGRQGKSLKFWTNSFSFVCIQKCWQDAYGTVSAMVTLEDPSQDLSCSRAVFQSETFPGSNQQ